MPPLKYGESELFELACGHRVADGPVDEALLPAPVPRNGP